MKTPAPRMAEVQPPLGTRDADIGQPTFFFELGGVEQRATVWKDAFF